MELDFLYTLRFRNLLPESQVKKMLLQLNKPYRYSFDCIYWDFKERVWKYLIETPELNILDNPEALEADNKDEVLLEYESVFHQSFMENKIYSIRNTGDNRLTDMIQSEFEIREAYITIDRPKTIILRNDDFIEFKS